ncbi:Uracil-DNA glycosylase [Heterocephalus glaber]|uniref:Uracil-DNA glycosylase n=1 Tax=Heterocephalus glaber TaxID=10181 RepID=G5AVJ3_HETGA|nr:Uracil-DNA glycosylase [Heterocephalus glaber]
MIGQKTQYSFCPSPARKRRACGAYPTDPGASVAAVAEETGDVAVAPPRRPGRGKPYFIKLMGFVAEERKHYTVYLHARQAFTWTQMCDIRDVKVVILGQDACGPNQVRGLCFSVQRPVQPLPSLENIYKELSTDMDGFVHAGHGDVSGWAKQGVLLLNTVLTVRAHQANSHQERG